MNSTQTTMPLADPAAVAALAQEVQRRMVGRPAPQPEPEVASIADESLNVLEEARVATGLKARFDALIEKQAGPYRQAVAAMVSRACQRHPKRIQRPDREATLLQSAREEAWVPVYSPCPDCEREQAETKIFKRWTRAGVPERLALATFDNFEAFTPAHAVARDEARARAELGRGVLILIGQTGTGKGHLASATMKVCGGGRWTSHPGLIAGLRATYGNDSTSAQEYLDALTWGNPLVVDEFGLRHVGRGGTGEEESALYTIFDTRDDRKKLTVITSNEEPKAIEAILGFRLMSRVRRSVTVITMPPGDYRSTHPE